MGHDASGDTIAHEHAPQLAHHFETPKQQFEAGKLGMWLFLSTEILLFSGLFCAYAVYRANHPEIFVYAHKYLDVTLGGINTVVLICSSLTMAWAVHCAQRGHQRGLVVLLALTLLCACGFLGIKYVEYQHKWKEGLLWGTRFEPKHEPGEHGAQGGQEDGVPLLQAALVHGLAQGDGDRSRRGVAHPVDVNQTLLPLQAEARGHGVNDAPVGWDRDILS